MGLFDFLKKRPSVVWRNKQGTVECPTDVCAQECDNNCPIWMVKQSTQHFQNGEYEEALALYKKAVEIAPNYKEAWHDMGVAYGLLEKHKEAKQCLLKAIKIDKNYKHAMWALIVTCIKLEEFEEAYKYCNKLEKIDSKSKADEMRDQVYFTEHAKLGTAEFMAVMLFHLACEEKIIDDVFSPIHPELEAYSHATCIDIFRELNNKDHRIWFSWSAFAGAGAFWLEWINKEELRVKGVAPLLLDQDAYAMDDYVLKKSFDYEPDSENAVKVREDFERVASLAYEHLCHGECSLAHMVIVMEAMYIFGIRYRMIKQYNGCKFGR